MKALNAVTIVLPLLLLQPAVAQQPVRSYLINIVNLDISAPNFDKFMASARENAEASLKDEGCHEFNMGLAKGDPHHVMFFEVCRQRRDAPQEHQRADRTFQKLHGDHQGYGRQAGNQSIHVGANGFWSQYEIARSIS